MDAEDLRKKVSGVLSGSIPASRTCETKLVICATTRQGRVTGESSARVSTGTVAELCCAAWMAVRSLSSSPVVPAVVSMRAASDPLRTHQPSAVRSTETVMSAPPSATRSTV